MAISTLLVFLALAALAHPDPLTRFRYGQALGNADVPGTPLPMYWSLRTHDRDGWQRLQLEGGTINLRPDRIRVVDTAGTVIAERATLTHEPRRTLGACDSHDHLGPKWWSHDLGADVIASVIRDDGRYRVEARLPDGWRRVRLFDTGCRILDVGRG